MSINTVKKFDNRSLFEKGYVSMYLNMFPWHTYINQIFNINNIELCGFKMK